MPELTAEQFAQRAYDMNLLDERQLESAWSQCGTRDVPTAEFRNLLIRREFLTNYQVDRLLRGERHGYFYGDYKVLYLVGTGSFARVYRAVHMESGDVVAVKVLRKRFCDDPLQTNSFVREGKMGMLLDHPNIVRIHGVYSEKRTHFLVMDFVEGQSLREFLKIRGRLEPLEATEIISGVVSGLAHATEKGLTHRDLKLSNILISSDGVPQLVDFGLAGVAGPDASSDSQANPRTIDYAGLERITGVRKDDPQSDIYFIGCIYYNLIVGEPPLPETRDRVQRLSSTRFREIIPIRQRLPDIPLAVEQVISKAMELDVEKRFNTPVDLLVELRKIKKGLETEDEVDIQEISTPLETKPRCLMLVESNANRQNALRKALKKFGFRVLVVGNPERAFKRIVDDRDSVDCSIVSTGDLGQAGLDLFQKLRQTKLTADLPAILLLSKNQASVKDQITKTDRHVAIASPLKMSELHQVLTDLLNARSA